MSYKHIQTVPNNVMIAASLAGLAISLAPPLLLARLLMMGALGTTAAIFRVLTVEVDEESIHWQFGNGFPSWSLPLSEISAVETIRTTPLMVWGIHYVGHGWLYNIYGLNAVDLTHKDGRHTIIGTDDAANLEAVISERI